jgi:hypothetical protein
LRAANWTRLWYLLSPFAVTGDAVYVAFAALGSWLGAFLWVTWLNRSRRLLRRCGRGPHEQVNRMITVASDRQIWPSWAVPKDLQLAELLKLATDDVVLVFRTPLQRLKDKELALTLRELAELRLERWDRIDAFVAAPSPSSTVH